MTLPAMPPKATEDEGLRRATAPTSNTAWLLASLGAKSLCCKRRSSDKTQTNSVHLLGRVRLFATPRTAARQASLSITNSRSLLKPVSIESVMPSNHLSLCHPLLLPPSIFPSIRVFSNEPVLCIRWPKYWSFSFRSFLPQNTQD